MDVAEDVDRSATCCLLGAHRLMRLKVATANRRYLNRERPAFKGRSGQKASHGSAIVVGWNSF